MRLLHISDTHVLDDYSRDHRESVLNKVRPPVQNLEDLLGAVADIRPDVIVHTGDVTHEGGVEDWVRTGQLFYKYAGGIPVLMLPGNHDSRPLLEACFGPWEANGCRKWEIEDYRFLALDTNIPGAADGQVTTAQENWLAEELRVPYGKGTILLGHHPLRHHCGWFATRVSESCLATIAGSDAMLWLCGHTHHFEAATLGPGFMQVTAGSMAFGLDNTDDEMVFTTTRSYCLLEIEKGAVWLEARPLHGETEVLYRKRFADPY